MTLVAHNAVIRQLDLAHDGKGFVRDEGMASAICLSLFTDRRVTVQELRLAGLPEDDQRGCWGDTYPDVEGDLGGSKLWLLDGAKLIASTFADARRYSEEALAWMLEDGIFAELGITAKPHQHAGSELGVIAIGVAPRRTPGAAPEFQLLYDHTTGLPI